MTGTPFLNGIHSTMASIILRCFLTSHLIRIFHIFFLDSKTERNLMRRLDYMKERAGSIEVEAMLSRTAPVFNGDIRSHERVKLHFSANLLNYTVLL